MKTSSLLSLDWNDLIKGLVVAVIGAVLTAIETALTSGSVDWKSIGGVAIAAGLSYLVKNFFTPAQMITAVAKPKS